MGKTVSKWPSTLQVYEILFWFWCSSILHSSHTLKGGEVLFLRRLFLAHPRFVYVLCSRKGLLAHAWFFSRFPCAISLLTGKISIYIFLPMWQKLLSRRFSASGNLTNNIPGWRNIWRSYPHYNNTKPCFVYKDDEVKWQFILQNS